MDLERDLFRVTLAQRDAPPEAALIDVVRKLNYTPSVVDAASFREGRDPVHAMGKAPDLVRSALERAKGEKRRFVLVDCMGDT
ncbi:MAG: hypothetical protein HYY16_14185 [Planctomycetes bacterium]|nr:hypothetical protein [Planctomycetota bacterium]